jgi:hypothetical protein
MTPVAADAACHRLQQQQDSTGNKDSGHGNFDNRKSARRYYELRW